jgi:hypothetical protein
MKSLVLLFVLIGMGYSSYSNQLVIDFYNQRLVFEYSESTILKKKLKPNEKDFKKFHEEILKSPYQSLVDGLQNYRKELQLNDWLYYVLIDKLCSSLDNREINASYLRWFLLGKSGYKLQIVFSKDHVSIFAESLGEEFIYGLPKHNKSYCLNCDELNDGVVKHTLPRFNPYQNNKVKFSFFFDPLPKFPKTTYKSKTFRLPLLGSTENEQVEVKFDSVLMSCQRDIDGFNLQQTFSVPLTANAKKLLDRIDEITKEYPDSIRVSYLMDFIIKNSRYSFDELTFKRDNKFATPEEFLFYKKGDCEDRSSFMFYALKEILKKPIVIVEYPNEQHVNVAVSIDLKVPPDFIYKGKPYYICETTTSVPLGKYNSLIKTTKYKITGEYNPEDTLQERKPNR